jgi:hypothetical protein
MAKQEMRTGCLTRCAVEPLCRYYLIILAGQKSLLR